MWHIWAESAVLYSTFEFTFFYIEQYYKKSVKSIVIFHQLFEPAKKRFFAILRTSHAYAYKQVEKND